MTTTEFLDMEIKRLTSEVERIGGEYAAKMEEAKTLRETSLVVSGALEALRKFRSMHTAT
jgi:hypothetical protein